MDYTLGLLSLANIQSLGRTHLELAPYYNLHRLYHMHISPPS